MYIWLNSATFLEVALAENYGGLQVDYNGIKHYSSASYTSGASEHTNDYKGRHLGPKPPWSRRRKWLLAFLGTLAICVIVGTSVGLLLSKSRGGESTKPEPTPAISSPATASSTFAFGPPTAISKSLPPSECLSYMCPQVLSTASFGSPSATLTFGRGADQAIWYRQADEQGWI
ncbi:hypothetical protein FZEAL_1015 [Fusarium zealandicum]|uniref:Uncharacterized protein n=1 Tax=Fusarium zealandicum TaxID=1053134 RepID=A0A8H4XP61_9HYPO|nr:hypothetical protein FZEAL_1015 [Fusarium zealandicum]